MARGAKTGCTTSSKIVLGILLAGALVLAATAVFMPQVREAFKSARGDAVLLIHADWCGHCKTLMQPGGVWERVKGLLPGVRFTEVLESSNEGKAAVDKYSPNGYPDIRVIAKDGSTVAEYTGAREAHAMMKWVKKYVAK
jgi:thiol-disulfide isomerase/thioredoxin